MLDAAAPETCCAIIPEARERKGSISSARPVGEKTLQWCAVITVESEGSMDSRCCSAVWRMLVVVVMAGRREGDVSVSGARAVVEGTMDVSSEARRGALVWCGSAGLVDGMASSMSPVLCVMGVEVSMKPIADGVGVTSGSFEGDSLLGLRRLAGVVGNLNGLVVVVLAVCVFGDPSVLAAADVFFVCESRPRFLVAAFAGETATGDKVPNALIRVERRGLMAGRRRCLSCQSRRGAVCFVANRATSTHTMHERLFDVEQISKVGFPSQAMCTDDCMQ